jgi:heat shock protein HslJ
MTPPVLPVTERSVEISLDFGKGGLLSGFGGLNNFSGPYSAKEDGRMEIGPLASTTMAGSPEMMNQEQALLRALESVASYRLQAGGLSLFDADGKAIVRALPQEQTALEGTTWKCIAYNNGKQAVTSVVAGTEITALFGEGSVTGSSGVNTYRASYELRGRRLSIDFPSTTSVETGSDDEMAQEQQYLEAIADVTSYRIERDELTLMGAGGVTLAQYLAEP